MSNWMPCLLGIGYVLIAGLLGYWLGCFREQLRLLEIMKPET
ncbi:hypothetical protein [Variovorax sp. PCZ-1]|jgi:hypothetical protein|nr:hypothetical protein [Variovorax sp. PCZ-1]